MPRRIFDACGEHFLKVMALKWLVEKLWHLSERRMKVTALKWSIENLWHSSKHRTKVVALVVSFPTFFLF